MFDSPSGGTNPRAFHCCPVKQDGESLNAMTDNGFQATKGVSDLNGKMRFRAISGGNSPGATHVYRQDAVRSTHGLPALEDLSSHRRSLRRRPLRKVHDMRRSIPRDGLRATDVPREPA